MMADCESTSPAVEGTKAVIDDIIDGATAAVEDIVDVHIQGAPGHGRAS